MHDEARLRGEPSAALARNEEEPRDVGRDGPGRRAIGPANERMPNATALYRHWESLRRFPFRLRSHVMPFSGFALRYRKKYLRVCDSVGGLPSYLLTGTA